MKVEYEGIFLESDYATMNMAFANIKATLLKYINDPLLMEKLFDGLILVGQEQNPGGGKYWDYVNIHDPKRVILKTGSISQLLIYHALFHFICLNVPKELNPAEILSHITLRCPDGRPITGVGNNNLYYRNMGYYNTYYTGYISIEYPNHQHPMYWTDEEAKGPSEDSADMFTSLIGGNIADNIAGDVIRDWLIQCLIDILKYKSIVSMDVEWHSR